MKLVQQALRYNFSLITHIRGSSENKANNDVKLRGIRIASTREDSPNMIFIPEVFDQAESWLQFFTNPQNRILENRNVYIVYPRNFGNSDFNPDMSWEAYGNDIMRFMYEHEISMATLAGHGLGAKIALATACYHFEKVTGVFAIDSVPYNQYYYEPFHELRDYITELKGLNLNRGFGAIVHDLKTIVKCPKWRSIFENNLHRSGAGYEWKFNQDAVFKNLLSKQPNSLTNWPKNNGLYPGRACFVFPEQSRYVYLNTNTLPMMSVCPQVRGWNEDIFGIQGDENPLNHWVYELENEVNPYAWRMKQFLKHYDGVHVLLKNRSEVGEFFVPDIANERLPREDFPTDRTPAHYYHNWRFRNPYKE